MLRRRLSDSLLRARATTQAPARQVAPPVPQLPAQYVAQNRGLASVVLLESREKWANKTVKGLKEALATRGLPR